jgi:hypothetical protein
MEGVTMNCNNGSITGRSIQANVNTYVSQLTITNYNPVFNGGNISCSLDSVSITTIGMAELMTSGILINDIIATIIPCL